MESEFKELTKMLDEFDENRERSDDEADMDVKRSVELENRRISALPVTDLEIEARPLYKEIASWKITEEALTPIAKLVEITANSIPAESERRAALLKIQESYEYLSDHIDWIGPRISWIGVFPVIAQIAGISVSIWSFC